MLMSEVPMYQTSEFPTTTELPTTSEFPTESPSHTEAHAKNAVTPPLYYY